MRWLSCSAARRGCHLGPPEDRRVPHQSDVDVIEPTSPVRAKPAQSSRARTRPSTDMQIHAYDREESQVRQGSEWLRTYWDELTPQLDASEAAFDTMLSFVTQNYANQPSSIYFSDCIMGVPSCVGALVQNEGSGPNGFDYQETHDNSINWWMLQLSSSPYFKLISYAEWIDRAELIPTPTEAAGILTSSTVSTGNSNTSDSTGSTCQQV